jgi:hypothetical protein
VEVKVKVKFSLCVIKYHAMKTYAGVEFATDVQLARRCARLVQSEDGVGCRLMGY